MSEQDFGAPDPNERFSWLDRRARSLVARALGSLREGQLIVADALGEQRFGTSSEEFPITARLEVREPAVYRRTLWGGSVGAGESYMDGDWVCSDLSALFRIMARNQETLRSMERHGWAVRSARRLAHALRANSLHGSRRNIAAHYDLGNSFFELFLDASLTYSSAVFENENATMEEAQIAKYDRICHKLELGPEDEVLEIGTGWGGFALRAAGHFGCKVTTATVSRQQFERARERVADAGLAERVRVIFEDYRRLRGRFDKLVSIEMIEAVGHRYLERYFRACSERLKPHGMMLVQAITVPDQRYERSRRGVDFTKAYIFPGGQVPSLHAMLSATRRVTDLRMIHLEEIGAHYAETLRRWREKFYKNLERVRELG
ncbi:MAG: cyclopropane-fatty-acyl-phospholipid synthase, partial [Gammaproteobacteria bacterium]